MSSSKYPFLKHPCQSGSEERFSHSLSCHHSFHIGITPMGSAVAILVSPLKGNDSKKTFSTSIQQPMPVRKH
ncbi:hypothetical protein GDO78_014865 [Eleutherodactylus coqui]|uniref:Uncharacterized protein n=1 Tax=Eleutherodactylus coqui TaxID=57060 RepID=A0A8J6B157_ELECQ|nr:hypothetical protein GDO78_014865 [Eleutherodactylus coqui]